MGFLTSKNITYAMFFGALASYVVGIIPDFLWTAETGLSIAAMLGFGSVAALRTFIKEKGWKTYAFTFGGVLASALFMAGAIDATTMETLVKLFASLSGFSLADGLVKRVE